jgi:hypothetical protein
MGFDDFWGEHIPSCKKCGDGEDVSDPGGENWRCSHCNHDIDSDGDCVTNDCSTCDDNDDDLSSHSEVKVLFLVPGNGIEKHPAIEVQGSVYLFTSVQKRRGEFGYLEVPEGEGGLKCTSFLNIKDRFDLESCTILCEWEYLSNEIMDEIYSELNRLHSDLAIENQSNEYDDVLDYHYGGDY